MGRAPCCDKIGLKKGPWTPEEDQKLLAYIEEHGHGSWRALPTKAGLQRCGKSCRLRWTNYLRPDIKRGKFSLQEEQTIIQLHALLGNRWSAIATHLQKRTDNEIKNYWNTHLKKRLAKMGIDPVTHKPKNDALLTNDGQSKSAANLSHMAQWESARLEAEARLVRQSKLRSGQSTSTQAQSVEFPSTSSQLHKPTILDVLKTWHVGGGDLESPTSTSTLSSSAGIRDSCAAAFAENMLKEECEDEWKHPLMELNREEIGNSMHDMMSFQPEPMSGNEHVPCGSFVEKFTDLLLLTSSGEDYYEDNKNYWNSILHLVDSSPSGDSPMF